MIQISYNVDVKVRNMSEQSVDIIDGRLKQFASQWQCITSDPFILNSVKHYKIEFENGEPQQCMPPKEINFTQQEQQVIDMEIEKLLIKGLFQKPHIVLVNTLLQYLYAPRKMGAISWLHR